MRLVSKCVADDGTEFSDEMDCLNYEAICAKVKSVMGLLHPPIDDPQFINGGGYIQQDQRAVTAVRDALESLAESGLRWHPELSRARHRVSCIDCKCREWGQVYFALNSNEAEQVCWNVWNHWGSRIA